MIDVSAVIQSAKAKLHVSDNLEEVSVADVLERTRAMLADLAKDWPSLNRETVLTQARELLADTITPYRWPEEQLTRFLDQGLVEVDKLRFDIFSPNSVTGEFTAALAHYVASRAVAQDNDYMQNNGALSEKLLQRFSEMTMAVPFRWTDELLTGFINDGIAAIRPLRRDIGSNGTVTGDYADAVAKYAASKAILTMQHMTPEQANQSNNLLKQFHELTAMQPYQYPENLFNGWLHLAKDTLYDLRPDLLLDQDGGLTKRLEHLPYRYAEALSDYVAYLGFVYYQRLQEATPYRESAMATFVQL